MKALVRTSAFVLMISVSLTCNFSFAQQSESTKPAAPRKQTATLPAQTPAETTPKPETPPEPKPAIREAPADKEKDKEERYDMTEVPPVITHHQITVDGKPLKYTATAGRLPIKRGDGKIEAEMFYVAYTLDGQDAAKRALTFAFNGGPGAASSWLHMGALGPGKVMLQADGFIRRAPYDFQAKPSYLLEKSYM